MSGAHTPGPWSWTLLGSHTGQIVSENDLKAGCVAHVYAKGEAVWNDMSIVGYADRAQFEANARLIAAAPDLLAALDGMLQAWPYTECGATIAARAAIAKAVAQATPSP